MFHIKRILVALILTAFSSLAIAEEKFCLDNLGYIYPLFDEPKCEKLEEEILTKKEFINIIQFETNERKAKLEEFRKNIFKDEIKTEKDIKVADVEKIKKESLQKIKNNKI